MREADRLIDIGPGAGSEGGRVIAQGTVAEVQADPNSITAAFLNRDANSVERRSRQPTTELRLVKANRHNLKALTVPIPLGVMTAVTGVSGSGKTTLISQTLVPALKANLAKKKTDVERVLQQIDVQAIEGFENIERLIEIDQSPIG